MGNSVTSESFAVGNDSWRGSRHGDDTNVSGTADISAFTSGTHYPNGFLLSGLPLAKLTGTGLYVPYGASPSEQQTIVVDATGGTFTISFDGSTTAAIATNATGAAVLAALELLPTINSGDVTVTRSGSANSYTYTLDFGGRYLGTNVPAVTTGAGSLTGGAGTATVATVVAGGGSGSGGSEVGVGFLAKAVKVPSLTDTTIDVPIAVYAHGPIREANLPIAVDAAFKADVAGRIWFI
jgi:hypothetical protein